MLKKVYLLRHGRTDAADRHIYCGKSDLPLNRDGIAALQNHIYPKADSYYITPCLRARQTLKILFGNVVHRECPTLMEYDFGDFELCRHAELQSDPGYLAWINDRTGKTSCPNGESRRQFIKRVTEGFQEICSDDFISAAIIAHGGSISVLMERLFPEEKNFYEWQPDYGKGWLVLFSNNRPLSYSPL